MSASGATLTASTYAEGPRDRLAGLKRWLRPRFGLHFVPLARLGEQLGALGYRDYWWSMPGPLFGYASARKVDKERAARSVETDHQVVSANGQRQPAATR